MSNRVKLFWVGLVVSILAVGGCQSTQKSEKPEMANEADTKSVTVQPEEPVDTTHPVQTVAKPAPTAPGVEGGVLTASPLVLEFGLIEPGVQQKGTYVLKNTGSAALKIKEVRSGCGCTVAKLSKYTLDPDETTGLEFVYNPGNYPGKTSKNIWVDLEAPSKPATLTLTFTADIRKFIDIDQERLTFNIKRGADNNGVIKLTSVTGEPFKVTGFTCRDNVVAGEFDPAMSAATQEIKYSVDMTKLRSLNSGIITLTTNHPKARSLSVYYSSVMPVVAHPPTRRFTALKQGVPSESSVKIVSNFAEEFELGEITSQKGLVKVLKTQKTSDGYQIDIAMTVDKPETSTAATRYLSDTLLINIKEYPDDVIRVYCYGQME